MRSLLPLCLLAAACGAPVEMPPAGGGSASPDDGPTYHRDIQPLVERSCVGCHAQGGVAPMAFDDPGNAVAFAGAMWAAIESKRMPPFFASADCNSYENDPRLTADEQALFKRWAEGGAGLGDPATAVHATPVKSPAVRADRSMPLAQPFDARLMGHTDNYQCFVLDPQASTDLWVAGYEVVPGNRALTHHVLAYVVPPEQVGELQALDDATTEQGYPCMAGGVGVSGAVANNIAGWVPGQAGVRLPEGTALQIPKGSKLVMQIHYNLLGLSSGGDPFDQTKLNLELTQETVRKATVLPMLKRDLAIDAYDANSVQTKDAKVGLLVPGATIYRLAGHMHQLGTSVKLEVVHADGSSKCLLHVPDWDFNWQRDYSLKTPVTLSSSDSLRITCTYDNSQANQPKVNGVATMPKNVTWGESTSDEMCMTYMTFTR